MPTVPSKPDNTSPTLEDKMLGTKNSNGEVMNFPSSSLKNLFKISRVLSLATGGDGIDVNNTDVLLVTASSSVIVNGLNNGVEGQILHLVVLSGEEKVTIKHNSEAGEEKILLAGKEDYVFEASETGGMILVFSGREWIECRILIKK